MNTLNSVKKASDPPTSNGIITVIIIQTLRHICHVMPYGGGGGDHRAYCCYYIYLLNKSHVGSCLSSSPWIFIHFVHLSASGGSVLTVCTFVLCSVNCSHPEFDCYCSLLITRLSLQLQRCEKTYLTGKARISCKANESGTT